MPIVSFTTAIALAKVSAFLRRHWMGAGIVILLVIGIPLSVWKYRNWQEDRSRQRIANVATEIIGIEATEKQIEENEGNIERTIENIAMREGATEDELDKAKEAVKEARKVKKKVITAQDLMDLLEE